MLLLGPIAVPAQETLTPRYDGSWESLQKMPVPGWFDDGKIGIFIHWGPYSAIGYKKGGRGYAEHVPKLLYDESTHYYPYMDKRWAAYPPEFGYKDIIPEFKAENWDPDAWVKLFADVGAKCVVLKAEHHGGNQVWDGEMQPEIKYMDDSLRGMITDFMNDGVSRGQDVYVNNKGANRNWPDGVGCLEKDNLKLKVI